MVLLIIPSSVLAKEIANRKYRFYYPERIYSEEFYKKGENDPEYPILGQAWHYSEEIYTSTKRPNDSEVKIVEEIPVLKYRANQKIRYIIIDGFESDTTINLQEIEIYDKERKIPYKINCTNCSSEFFAKIQNTIRIFEYNYISNKIKLTLDLQGEYYPDDLRIEIYFGGAVGKTAKFVVTANNTKDNKDIYYQYIVSKALMPDTSNIKNLKDARIEERLEDEIKEIKGVETMENAKILERKVEYKYKEKQYQYYKEIRHYIDGYHDDLKGLIKDSKDFIEVEKEKEPDPIVITEYIEKEVYVPTTITEYVEREIPTTITEYIEKEVLVPTEVTRYLEKEVPIIKESIKYQDKIIEKEVPVESEKIVEKVVEKKSSKNYLLEYTSYLLAAVFLKKLSFFKS